MPADKSRFNPVPREANVFESLDDGLFYCEVNGAMLPIDRLDWPTLRSIGVSKETAEGLGGENVKRRVFKPKLPIPPPAPSSTVPPAQAPTAPPPVFTPPAAAPPAQTVPVPPAGDDDGECQEMDRLDEDQISDELRGKTIGEYVYIPKGSNKPRLSWAGVKAVVHRMGHIHTQDVIMKDIGDGFEGKAIVIDVRRDLQVIAFSRQSKKKQLRSGEIVDDDQAFLKCSSKATRNAWYQLIPAPVARQMIQEWLKKKGLAQQPTQGQSSSGMRPSEEYEEEA